MVLTTVGIGDKSPESWAGQVYSKTEVSSQFIFSVQIVGGICALVAVFLLALPVPIIVNR